MKNKMLEKQGWHALVLGVLLVGCYFATGVEGMLDGELFGLSTFTWLWITIAVPIAHQVFVGLAWRGQLHTQWMTKLFGEKDFIVFTVVFMILFVGRFVSMIFLAGASQDSLQLDMIWRVLISLALFIPGAYLGYSVVRYFGVKRALGADHFDPDHYRALPMVKEGIFKYTSNGMYTYGFFLLWIPGVLLASKAALLAAAFNHLYIWVHFYTTEKPDMGFIYGGGE